mmetsp:Transcript_9110/g.23193  ORF Transcript_9110/g.23193 Transcript_9110/m.23193 type:complete len:213 (+) Transcript_9110:396-1034(+)
MPSLAQNACSSASTKNGCASTWLTRGRTVQFASRSLSCGTVKLHTPIPPHFPSLYKRSISFHVSLYSKLASMLGFGHPVGPRAGEGICSFSNRIGQCMSHRSTPTLRSSHVFLNDASARDPWLWLNTLLTIVTSSRAATPSWNACSSASPTSSWLSYASAQSMSLYPFCSAILTAAPTCPGGAFHVPSPRLGSGVRHLIGAADIDAGIVVFG